MFLPIADPTDGLLPTSVETFGVNGFHVRREPPVQVE